MPIKFAELSNEKHKAQWRSTLEQCANPHIGDMLVRDKPLYRAEIKMPEGSSEPVRFPEFLVNEYGDLRGVNALGSSSTATFTDQSVGSCFRWCPDPERQDECINIGACPGGTGGPADIYDVVTISPRYSTSSDRVDYDISIQAEVLASPKTYSVEGFYLTNDGKIDAGE